MQDTQNKDSGSLSSFFKKVSGTILKYGGFGGLVFYTWVSKSINDTIAADPSASALDGITDFYGNTIYALTNDALPGIGYLLKDTFNFAAGIAADFVMPGSGAAVTSAINIFDPASFD